MSTQGGLRPSLMPMALPTRGGASARQCLLGGSQTQPTLDGPACLQRKISVGGAMQKTIAVDASKCVHCGMCIQDCVLGIIEFDDNEIPQHTSGGSQQCVACQHCMAVCPTGALSFGGKDPETSYSVGFGNSDDLLRLMQSRRRVRFDKNESQQKKSPS